MSNIAHLLEQKAALEKQIADSAQTIETLTTTQADAIKSYEVKVAELQDQLNTATQELTAAKKDMEEMKKKEKIRWKTIMQ